MTLRAYKGRGQGKNTLTQGRTIVKWKNKIYKVAATTQRVITQSSQITQMINHGRPRWAGYTLDMGNGHRWTGGHCNRSWQTIMNRKDWEASRARGLR